MISVFALLPLDKFLDRVTVTALLEVVLVNKLVSNVLENILSGNVEMMKGKNVTNVYSFSGQLQLVALSWYKR